MAYLLVFLLLMGTAEAAYIPTTPVATATAVNTPTPRATDTPPPTPVNTATAVPTPTPPTYRSQFISDTGNSNLATNVTQYIVLSGVDAPDNSELVVDQHITLSTTLKNLYCEVHGAPGSGSSWTIVLRKNFGDTAVTCTIADTNTSCTDSTHTSSGIQGDTFDYSTTPSVSNPAAGKIHCAIEADVQ